MGPERRVSRQHLARAVSPQVRRVVVVRLPLAHVPVPVIETLQIRLTAVTWTPEAPLADRGRHITRVLKHPADRVRLRRKGVIALDQGVSPHVTALVHLVVVPHHRVARVEACQERGSRWGAYGAAGIVPGETHSLRRESIELRRLNPLLTEAPQLTIAQVVSHDEDDVRPGRRRIRLTCDEIQRQQSRTQYLIL